MRRVVVDYTINEKNKFLRGTLISETDTHVKVKGLRDGVVFTIKKEQINEMRLEQSGVEGSEKTD